jgi:LytS/YehU family sensor histidine kinase
MRRRFAQQLDVRVDVAADVEGVMVPRFMLQPIVENSLEHGIARREGAGTVEVRARRDGDSLVISVYDDGPGLPALDDVRGNGIGLRNTERRLAAMYGTRGSLVLGRAALGGTAVTITIPVS